MTNCCNKKNYSYEYPRPVVATDAIIYNSEGKILLIKRNIYPYKDCWALPGGHVGDNENSKMACCREVKEETGLDITDVFLVDIAEEKNRDPRTEYVISIVYSGRAAGNPTGGDDASEAKWFSIKEINDLELAFDHFDLINKCLNLMRLSHGLPT